MSPRDNAGDGIRLAEHAGAALGSGYASPAFWAPVSVLERPASRRCTIRTWCGTAPSPA